MCFKQTTFQFNNYGNMWILNVHNRNTNCTQLQYLRETKNYSASKTFDVITYNLYLIEFLPTSKEKGK